MKLMNNQQKWEVVRKRGRIKYIVLNGMILFGLPLGIASTLVRRLFENEYSFHSFITVELFGDVIARGIFYMLLVGLIYGVLTWKSNEKKYHHQIGKSNDLNE